MKRLRRPWLLTAISPTTSARGQRLANATVCVCVSLLPREDIQFFVPVDQLTDLNAVRARAKRACGVTLHLPAGKTRVDEITRLGWAHAIYMASHGTLGAPLPAGTACPGIDGTEVDPSFQS